MNSYEQLGISETATQDEIKDAYRKLAKEWHPDRHPEAEKPAAEEKFKAISAAYETLRDEDKRRQYDAQRNMASNGPWSYDNFDPFGAAFHGMGGMGFRQRKPVLRRGEDIRGVMEVELPEAAAGCVRKIYVNRHPPCSDCGASGAKKAQTCNQCYGAGQVMVNKVMGNFHVSQQVTCPSCSGKGKIIHEACGKCHGSGDTQTEETIELTVPAGVGTNDVLRVKEKGHAGEGGAGDLLVIIRVKPHGRFTRVLNELHATAAVPFATALAGGTITFTDLFGTCFELHIPKACKYGHELSIQGKGILGSAMKVKVEYSLPELSAEQLDEVIKAISK